MWTQAWHHNQGLLKGLGQTDIGNKSAFGGIALEFYRDVAKWYADPTHWTLLA